MSSRFYYCRMFGVIVRRSLSLQRGAFTDLVFFLVLILSCRGQELIGPSQPIVALVGDDVILPCHLKPTINVYTMTVEWARPDLDPRFVFVWRDGLELESKKHPTFRGRTSVFIDELRHGNVSLKLSKVKLSDGGGYKCFIPTFFFKSVMVQLVVGGVSSPDVQLTQTRDGVMLECESKGWYPEPEMFWLDAEGNLLSALSETLRGPDGLYTVSSRLSVERRRHGDNFTCRVTQRDINQIRENHITVPAPTNPSSPGSQHAVIRAVIGCALVLILVVLLAVWKRRQIRLICTANRSDENRKSEEEDRETKSKKQRDEERALLTDENESKEERRKEEKKQETKKKGGSERSEVERREEREETETQEEEKPVRGQEDQTEEPQQSLKVKMEELYQRLRRYQQEDQESALKIMKKPNQTRGGEEKQTEKHLGTESTNQVKVEKQEEQENRMRDQTEESSRVEGITEEVEVTGEEESGQRKNKEPTGDREREAESPEEQQSETRKVPKPKPRIKQGNKEQHEREKKLPVDLQRVRESRRGVIDSEVEQKFLLVMKELQTKSTKK